MGISTNIYLPENARFGDIVNVIGVAVGYTPEYRKFNMGGSDGGATYVDGIVGKNSEYSAGCADIRFDGRWAFFMFEPEQGGRLISAGGTEFWAAVGRRLVDFFGGYVDYNDCDDIEADYSRRPKPRSVNAPTNGEAWEKFQQRLLKVKPINKSELDLTDNGDGTYSDGTYVYRFDDNGNMIREA